MATRVRFLCVIAVMTGCTSIRSTALDRTESGCLTAKPDTECLKGVPVMVKVPTHLEVRVYQRDHWYQTKDSDRLVPVKEESPVRFVETRVAKTEQMFVVDPKRPAEGTGIYGFTFASGLKESSGEGHGYLRGVEYKSEDQTLEASANLALSLASILRPNPGTVGQESSTTTRKGADGSDVTVFTTKRLVAFRRFPLNSPSVDHEVEAFLDLHLNHCQSCAAPPSYPTQS